MSVFKVQLTNSAEGLLDTAGQSSGTSVQRTVYLMGPNRINRKLVDGATFTDVNYFKRYCYPQVTLDEAILTLVTDDGSPWVDNNPIENNAQKVYSLTLTSGTTYSSNVCDILDDMGGYATFAEITPTVACKMRINGNVNAIMSLTANTNYVFNPGDITFGKVEFDNSASGASTGTVQVVVSVQAIPNS